MPPKDPNYWKDRRAAAKAAKLAAGELEPEWDPLDHVPSPASVKRHFKAGKTAAIKACPVGRGPDGEPLGDESTCYQMSQRVNAEKYARRQARLAAQDGA